MLLLGIDVGTSGCKIAFFNETGECVASRLEEHNTYYPHPRYVEQDPMEWWDCVSRGIRELVSEYSIDPHSIAGIGIDSQSWSAISIDDNGEVLCNSPIWMDTRAHEIAAKIENRIGKERLFNVSSNPFSPCYTLPKLLFWMEHEKDLLKKTRWILQGNSFIAYKLTGAISQDYSMCYGWHNFNQFTLKYDEDLTRELGIDPKYLIEPLASDQIVGHVTKQAAKICGLSEGIPVVAGGLDAACGTLGVGVIGHGQTQEQGGQSGGMSICLSEPVAHPNLILSAHVVPDRWLLQGGTIAGGASMKWFANAFGARMPGKSFAAEGDVYKLISEEASYSPPGAGGLVFLPYLNGERSPIWDPEACGMFFGLNFETSHELMARAIMEGVAYSLRHNVETAAEAGVNIEEFRSMGGSANSSVWCQIKSDVTRKRVLVPESDTATSFGAALLAGVGVKLYPSYEDALRNLKIKREYSPQQCNLEIYDGLFSIYKQLYVSNKASMAELSSFRKRNTQ